MAKKKFSAEFKARVALELIQGELTLSELSSKYSVHPTQIKEWKAKLKEEAKTIFEKSGKKQEEKEAEKGYTEALERKAGQLAVEVDFLKKNLERYHGSSAWK